MLVFIGVILYVGMTMADGASEVGSSMKNRYQTMEDMGE